MAHYAKVEYGKKPNFLASEVGLRLITIQVDEENANGVGVITSNGRKFIQAGTLWSDDGIIFETVDITDGACEATLMVGGYVYKDKVIGEIDEMIGSGQLPKGLFFETSDAITRPEN